MFWLSELSILCTCSLPRTCSWWKWGHGVVCFKLIFLYCGQRYMSRHLAQLGHCTGHYIRCVNFLCVWASSSIIKALLVLEFAVNISFGTNSEKNQNQTTKKPHQTPQPQNKTNNYKLIYFLFLFLLENLKWKVMFIFILSVHKLQLEWGIFLFVF